MLQIDKLTKALVDSQKRLATASAAAAVPQQRHVFNKTADSVRADAAGEKGSSSSEVAEMRLQLAAAEISISHLRTQLADSKKESRAAASTTWKSSADVTHMLEEQADRCVP